jgi:hypothetical protein
MNHHTRKLFTFLIISHFLTNKRRLVWAASKCSRSGCLHLQPFFATSDHQQFLTSSSNSSSTANSFRKLHAWKENKAIEAEEKHHLRVHSVLAASLSGSNKTIRCTVFFCVLLALGEERGWRKKKMGFNERFKRLKILSYNRSYSDSSALILVGGMGTLGGCPGDQGQVFRIHTVHMGLRMLQCPHGLSNRRKLPQMQARLTQRRGFWESSQRFPFT